MSALPKLILSQADKVVIAGDSLTFFFWYLYLIMLGARKDVGPSPDISWINSGVSGNTSGDIDAAVASRITAYQAQALIIEVGRNDVVAGVTDLEFTQRFNGIVDKARAAQPNLKIACVNIFLNGEDIPNSYDTDINAKNAIMAATMARVGGTYMDVRSKVVAWEIANNVTHATSGLLTAPADGVHPNDFGKVMMGLWVDQYIQYVT